MANTLFLNQPFVFCGLGTLVSTVATAGLYNVHVEASEVPPSGLTVTVKQNGSTKYTSPTLSPTQGGIQMKTELNCAASDAIEVDLTSGQAIDSNLNTVKSTVTLGQGQ